MLPVANLKSSSKLLLSIDALNMSHRDCTIISLEIVKNLFEIRFNPLALPFFNLLNNLIIWLGCIFLKTSFALFFLVFDYYSPEVNADSGTSSASVLPREAKCSLNVSEIFSLSESVSLSPSLT